MSEEEYYEEVTRLALTFHQTYSALSDLYTSSDGRTIAVRRAATLAPRGRILALIELKRLLDIGPYDC